MIPSTLPTVKAGSIVSLRSSSPKTQTRTFPAAGVWHSQSGGDSIPYLTVLSADSVSVSQVHGVARSYLWRAYRLAQEASVWGAWPGVLWWPWQRNVRPWYQFKNQVEKVRLRCKGWTWGHPDWSSLHLWFGWYLLGIGQGNKSIVLNTFMYKCRYVHVYIIVHNMYYDKM